LFIRLWIIFGKFYVRKTRLGGPRDEHGLPQSKP